MLSYCVCACKYTCLCFCVHLDISDGVHRVSKKAEVMCIEQACFWRCSDGVDEMRLVCGIETDGSQRPSASWHRSSRREFLLILLRTKREIKALRKGRGKVTGYR